MVPLCVFMGCLRIHGVYMEDRREGGGHLTKVRAYRKVTELRIQKGRRPRKADPLRVWFYPVWVFVGLVGV